MEGFLAGGFGQRSSYTDAIVQVSFKPQKKGPVLYRLS